MREAQFLQRNADKWKEFETETAMKTDVDKLAAYFIDISDDLSYAKTFFPDSNTTKYLNGLATQLHQKIYQNKKEKKGRLIWFWQFELPVLFKQYHRQFLYAFLFFIVFCLVGAISAKYDDNFIRLILGDAYVNMTNENIDKGNPFGIYQGASQISMFFQIAYNNIQVAFVTYMLGVFVSVGSVWMLMRNALMLGSFQYFFIAKGLGVKFITVVFLHGTLEIWSIIIAGAAGMILGNSILFPKTYSRKLSCLKGGKDGLKIVVGLVPFFLVAAFIESFITRYANMPLICSLLILLSSAGIIIWYFIVYPILLNKKIDSALAEPDLNHHSVNLNAWLNKKLNSEK